MKNRVTFFDARTGRPVIHDIATGDEVSLRQEELAGLLECLAASGEKDLLRAFARECVLQANNPPHAGVAVILGCKEENRANLREQLRSVAMATSAIGLPRGYPAAARYMAAYATLEEKAIDAARGAAHMARLHAELKGGASGLEAALREQIDFLLDRWPAKRS
jgi:hypothetical protein